MALATIGGRQLQQISEILRALDERPLTPAANRRQHMRMSVRLTLAAVLLADAALPQVRIFTRNISTSGMGFVSRRLFKPGEMVAIHISTRGVVGKLVRCRTTFCRYVRGGLYEVGVEFQEGIPVRGPRLQIPADWLGEAEGWR